MGNHSAIFPIISWQFTDNRKSNLWRDVKTEKNYFGHIIHNFSPDVQLLIRKLEN